MINNIIKKSRVLFLIIFIFTFFGVNFTVSVLFAQASEDVNMNNTKDAVFAGGCFWHMEYVFEKVPGVIDVISGYTGGSVKDPTYEQVSTGNTGHYESVLIKYNPELVSFERLLEVFWKNIDPVEPVVHGNNHGSQYRTAIFYSNAEEKQLAEESKERIIKAKIFGESVSTKILRRRKFYPAEDYHQNYYRKHPESIPSAGRSGTSFYNRVWGKHKYFRLFPEKRSYWLGYQKPSKSELKRILNDIQYRITQEDGTEPPFNNEYWDNHRAGIYVDIVSGEPLFSSIDKFDSGTGWPSFTKPLEPYNVVHKDILKLNIRFAEVRSRYADSHLGHVFKEKTPTGLRYCIDSAALRFIPVDELEKYGYGSYRSLF